MGKLNEAHLFEVSWEVCNKVGGIHTVLRSKAAQAQAMFGDNYCLIGPLLPKNIEFEETDEMWGRSLREPLAVKGLNCRFGRWTIASRPKVILVESGRRYNPEQLLFRLWEGFGVDSIAGGWDYIEPVLFSTACGEVIVSASKGIANSNGNRVIAHFHEWMTGAGLLYVKDHAPQVATVFTTHATVLGRSLAGGGRDIYEKLEEIAPIEEAKNCGVTAKHSMEYQTARHADCFTTVSEITAREAHRLLGQKPAVITENGIDIEAIPNLCAEPRAAQESRRRILDFAAQFLGRPVPENARLIMISGRYEFVNKGLDVFIEALGPLQESLSKDRPLLAFVLIPGAHLEHKPMPGAAGSAAQGVGICTHRLPDENNDPILTTCLRLGLQNQPDNPVSVIFIPVYLSEGDGVLNMSYYDVLQGFDLGVFPSKYEPWGYTPMESVAYCVPTATSDLAGFGIWARHQQEESGEDMGVSVLARLGKPQATVVAALFEALKQAMSLSDKALADRRAAARRLAERASWSDFYAKYREAYLLALRGAEKRAFRKSALDADVAGHVFAATESTQPHFRSFVVETKMPRALGRLRELAYNLWWTWHPQPQDLFQRVDPNLWETFRHNPVRVLDDAPTARLAELAANEAYVKMYREVLADFDAYMACETLGGGLKPSDDLTWSRPVAYLSTEFGLHESLAIYSGGLGVLSGDHLKSASDLNIPLVGVGLFYGHGYFRQTIDAAGNQVAHYVRNEYATLPLKQLQDEDGAPTSISVELPGRTLYASIWKLLVGRITVYLLNTDLPENTVQDREITSQLYVGDERTRIEQEILLGIGGSRLLRRLGITPGVYHLNEGHSAFIIFENIRTAMHEQGMTFDEARELVRNQTLFTTHTPVEAGNERFSRELMQHYFAHYVKEVGLSWDKFFELGRVEPGEGQPFVMTVAALKNAFISNGVSKLHARVSRQMWQRVWGGAHRSTVPITAVTNGIHIPTFVGPEMTALLDTYLGSSWNMDLLVPEKWRRVDAIPDNLLWETKLEMRQRLIAHVRDRVAEHWSGNAEPGLHRDEVVSRLRASSLTIGFARRFAPYKRANLLFSDLERLERIVGNTRRPVQFIFAGKAHPKDTMGCDLVREVVRITRDKRFAGRVVFLEDYDLMTAKLMVQGVDVWLNTPRRPYEASGTSGQKVAINGGINLSVADGWWCEGAADGNGWTIGAPPNTVDEESASDDRKDADHLYSLIEDAVVPLYYQRNSRGLPEGWLAMMRRSMQTIVPYFNTHRMLMDYFNQLYRPCAERSQAVQANHGTMARLLADWKRKMPSRFSSMQLLDIATSGVTGGIIQVGKAIEVTVRIDLGDLKPSELLVELVVGPNDPKQQVRDPVEVTLAPVGDPQKRVQLFRGSFVAKAKGTYAYGIRIMPWHEHLGNKYEPALAVWA